MPVTKVSGQAGQVLLDAATPSINKWSLTIKSDLQKTTGSDNFDTTTEQLWASMAKGVYSAEGSVEGKYDIDATGGTAAVVLAAMMDNDPKEIVLGITRDVDYGYGLFHMSELETSLELEGEVNWSAKITLTDKFTPGTPAGP